MWHNGSMVNKNNNHDACCGLRVAGLGSEESPMVAGCWAGPAQCGVRNAECGMNTEGDRICQGGKAEFEDWCLKTKFREKHGMESGDRHLSPAQWLPKPATSQLPHKSNALRATWSPIEAERVNVADAQGGDECVLASVQSRVGLAGERQVQRPKSEHIEHPGCDAMCCLMPDAFIWARWGKPRQPAPTSDIGADFAGAVQNLSSAERGMQKRTSGCSQVLSFCTFYARARFGGGFSLISSCFHLFPVVSAVLIIKIISKQALGRRASSAGLGAESAGFHGTVSLNLA
jgi:hypothetical protein